MFKKYLGNWKLDKTRNKVNPKGASTTIWYKTYDEQEDSPL